jgi:hypothetical protein
MLSNKYFIPTSTFVLGFLFELFLGYLFPYPGFAAIIFIPLTWLLTGLICLVQFFILKKMKNFHLRLILSLITLICIISLEIKLYRTEGGLPPKKAFPTYWRTLSNYPDRIEFKDIVSHNEAKRVAAIKKYDSELPDYVINFDFDTYGQYIIEVENNTWKYDTSLISINKTNDSCFVDIINHNKKIGFPIHFLEYGSLFKIDSNNHAHINKDKLEFDTGIEKLFYFILY